LTQIEINRERKKILEITEATKKQLSEAGTGIGNENK